MAGKIRPRGAIHDVGDLVEISGTKTKVRGEVILATTPDKMPRLGPEAEQAMALVPEWGTDFILVIRNFSDAKLVMALHHPGGWRDYEGHELTVAAVSGAG